MPSTSTLLLFAAASFALIVVPGPAVMYIVARSLEGGRRAGVVSVLGVEVGGLVHVTAAALGLSAIIASSAVAFSVIKYAGAAYLIALGVTKLLRTRSQPGDPQPETGPVATRRLFWHGVMVNVLNPKTAIFFLAFLPQFIDPDRGAVPLQAGILGASFLLVATVSDGAYAIAAGSAGRWLRSQRGPGGLLDRFSGCVYVGLGTFAAVTGERPPAATTR